MLEQPRLAGLGAGKATPYCDVASSLPPTQPMVAGLVGQLSVSASMVFMVPALHVSMLSHPPTGRPARSIWKTCLGRIQVQRLKFPTPLSLQYTEPVEYGNTSLRSIVCMGEAPSAPNRTLLKLGSVNAHAEETEGVGVFEAVWLADGDSVGVIDGSAPADAEVEDDEVGVGTLEADRVIGV